MRVLRTSLAVLLGLGSFIASGGDARASFLEWEGTLSVDVGNLPGGVSWTGMGVATVNGGAGGTALQSVRMAGGLTQGPSPALTFFDVPTHALVQDFWFLLDPRLGTGTLGGFSASGPLSGRLPVKGTQYHNAVFPIPPQVPLSTNGGATGLGVGGSLELSRPSTIMGEFLGRQLLSIEFAPWTLGTAMVMNSAMHSGPFFSNATTQGFLHGPASNTSTAAAPGGVLQLVTPMQITWDDWPKGGVPDRLGRIGEFGKLKLRFVPEPGRLVLLGAGVGGLVLMGMRRRATRR